MKKATGSIVKNVPARSRSTVPSPFFFPNHLSLGATDHSSNPIGPEYEAVLRAGNDFVLNIGAGGTAQRYPNCIEFEHKIFRHTDVVGDAHHLPFRDATFDRVFAFNVFEHLADPRAAAQEIHRVLKPGGGVVIHTAFLQALHEEPHHFYNATEYGVRRWFAPFEIEDCRVSGNFGPGVMLAFLMSHVLESARLGERPLQTSKGSSANRSSARGRRFGTSAANRLPALTLCNLSPNRCKSGSRPDLNCWPGNVRRQSGQVRRVARISGRFRNSKDRASRQRPEHAQF